MFARKNVFYLRCFRTFRGSCESVTKQDTAGDSRELRTSRGFGEAESAETPRPRAETHPGRRAGCAAVARQCPSLCLSDSSSGKPDLHFSAHAPGPPPPGKTRPETPPPAHGTPTCPRDHPVRASCRLFPGGLLRPRCSGSSVLSLFR